MELYGTETYHGLEICTYYDDCADNPRDWDNVATFVCEHPRYKLGDEHNIEEAVNELYNKYVTSEAIIKYFIETRKAKLIDGEDGDAYDHYYEYETAYRGETHKHYINADSSYGEDEIAGQMEDDFGLGEKMWLVIQSGEVVAQSISMYEHSGIELWLGSYDWHVDAQWDCSSIGFAYIEKSTAEREMPNRKLIDGNNEDWKQWSCKVMEAEMEVYDQYASGNVFCFVVNDENGDVLDSCGGYYGESGREDALREAREQIDFHLNKKQGTRERNLQFLRENISTIDGRMYTDGQYLYRIDRDMFGLNHVERAEIHNMVVGCFTDVALSELSDEILESMVNEIKINQKL